MTSAWCSVVYIYRPIGSVSHIPRHPAQYTAVPITQSLTNIDIILTPMYSSTHISSTQSNGATATDCSHVFSTEGSRMKMDKVPICNTGNPRPDSHIFEKDSVKLAPQAEYVPLERQARQRLTSIEAAVVDLKGVSPKTWRSPVYSLQCSAPVALQFTAHAKDTESTYHKGPKMRRLPTLKFPPETPKMIVTPGRSKSRVGLRSDHRDRSQSARHGYGKGLGELGSVCMLLCACMCV
jgi:hypothetical protein